MPAATKKNTKPSKKSVAKKKPVKRKSTTKAKRNPKKKPELPSVDVNLLDFPDDEDEESQSNDKPKPGVKTVRYCRRCLDVLKPTQKAFCTQRCNTLYQAKFNIFFKRPSTYDEKYAGDDMLKEYLIWIEEMNQNVYIESARGVLGHLKQMEVPSVTGYCAYIGVHKRTGEDWRAQHTDFDNACLMINSYQEVWITNKVSEGLMERGTANLLLGHNHGIIQKKETENKHLHMVGFVEDVYAQVEAMEKGVEVLPAASETQNESR